MAALCGFGNSARSVHCGARGHEACVVNAVWALDRAYVFFRDSTGGLRAFTAGVTPNSDEETFFISQTFRKFAPDSSTI